MLTPSFTFPPRFCERAGNELGCARISMMARSISSNTRPETFHDARSLSLAGSCFSTESARALVWVFLSQAELMFSSVGPGWISPASS